MSMNKRHYEQLREALGDGLYNEVFAPLKDRYARQYLDLYMESTEKESALARSEFKEIMTALNGLEIADES